MSTVGAVAGWLSRKALLYALLVLAIGVFTIFGPRLTEAWQRGDFARDAMSQGELARAIGQVRDRAAADWKTTAAEVGALPAEALAARLEDRREALKRIERERSESGGLFDAIRPSAILARKRLEIEAAVVEREIALLENAAERHSLAEHLAEVRRLAAAEVVRVRGLCDRANAAVRRFNQLALAEKVVRNRVNDEADRLTRDARRQCDAARDVTRRQNERVSLAEARLDQAERAYAAAQQQGLAAITAIKAEPTRRLIGDILVKAALALALILAMPYLIRLLCYTVLAPLAERRPAIRLRVPGSAEAPPIVPGDASTTSVALALQPGEELLVREDYLQTSSLGGAKTTRWLLDWRHPFASLAAGLAFMTRVRGAGEVTTISAVRDPLGEVTVVTLPEGSACVLQARTLAAVAQPIGRPLRITSRWRIGSLNAWLTLQLRYLVFHGPARLVLKGRRGVRLERAERGRVFGQAQLVGFSADLAYSVTRTETFWSYFLGRQDLLKDKVEAGKGVLIIEEAPLAGGADGKPRGGLEGAIDALLKTFGL